MGWKFLFALALMTPLAFGSLAGAADKAWKEEDVKIGDIKVRYLEAGGGDRYLVFIPGWTMIAEVWQEQIPYFAARGFHVIAMEPRSHGKTTKTDEANTYGQHAADLHAFLRTLEIENVSLVGWSAAVVTLLDYMASPESVRPEKLIFVDGFPRMLQSQDYPGGHTLQDVRSLALGLQENRRKFTDEFVRGMFKSRQAESIYAELSEGSLRTPIGAANALLFDLVTGDRSTALLRIRTPTLIIVTEDNRLLGEYVEGKIREAKLEVIPDAGHALFLEKPQTFNQTVEAFLNAP